MGRGLSPGGQEKEIPLCTVLQFWGFVLASFHLSLWLYFKGEEAWATGVKLIPSSLLSKAAEEPIRVFSPHVLYPNQDTRLPGDPAELNGSSSSSPLALNS